MFVQQTCCAALTTLHAAVQGAKKRRSLQMCCGSSVVVAQTMKHIAAGRGTPVSDSGEQFTRSMTRSYFGSGKNRDKGVGVS